MALECNARAIFEVTGLSSDDFNWPEKFTTSTTPDTHNHQKRTQATTDVAEALGLGDVSTVELVMIKAVTNDLHVDCDFVSSFDADIEIQEGEFAIFKPVGSVYIKNATAEEVCVYEYVVVGTT